MRGVKFIRKYLAQGLSPSGIAASSAAGVSIALFPIMGCSTLMCGAASLTGRLNLGLMYAVCVMLTAAKLALIIPFLKLGEAIMRAEPFTLSLVELTQRWHADWRAVLVEFSDTFLHAMLGWAVCVPLMLALTYVAAHAVASRLSGGDARESVA